MCALDELATQLSVEPDGFDARRGRTDRRPATLVAPGDQRVDAVACLCAGRATAEVEEEDTTVPVSMRDDGDGFEAATKTQGFGLLGMHDRAELVGTLEIQSGPGSGPTVSVVVRAQPNCGAFV